MPRRRNAKDVPGRYATGRHFLSLLKDEVLPRRRYFQTDMPEGTQHTRNLASLRPADHLASRCASRRVLLMVHSSVQTFAVSRRHIYNVKVCTLPLSELD